MTREEVELALKIQRWMDNRPEDLPEQLLDALVDAVDSYIREGISVLPADQQEMIFDEDVIKVLEV
jgi:hypothetical protein